MERYSPHWCILLSYPDLQTSAAGSCRAQNSGRIQIQKAKLVGVEGEHKENIPIKSLAWRWEFGLTQVRITWTWKSLDLRYISNAPRPSIWRYLTFNFSLVLFAFSPIIAHRTAWLLSSFLYTALDLGSLQYNATLGSYHSPMHLRAYSRDLLSSSGPYWEEECICSQIWDWM